MSVQAKMGAEEALFLEDYGGLAQSYFTKSNQIKSQDKYKDKHDNSFMTHDLHLPDLLHGLDLEQARTPSSMARSSWRKGWPYALTTVMVVMAAWTTPKSTEL